MGQCHVPLHTSYHSMISRLAGQWLFLTLTGNLRFCMRHHFRVSLTVSGLLVLAYMLDVSKLDSGRRCILIPPPPPGFPATPAAAASFPLETWAISWCNCRRCHVRESFAALPPITARQFLRAMRHQTLGNRPELSAVYHLQSR